MSKDKSRLCRLGVLAPAALSACMDASVLAVPAAGAIVSTVLKELSKAFMLKKWFYGIMSAKEAESLMLERGRNGSFLVRESQSRPGEFVLSVRVRGRVSHVMIRRQDGKYDVGSGEKFDDLVGLIEHFRYYPLTESSGDVLRLLQPLSGTRLRAQDIHDTVRKMQRTEDIESRRGFDGEFYSLKLLEERNVFTTNEGMRPENFDKNRYRNILPYDQTRVILSKGDDSSYSDYINANYIRSSRLCGSNSSVQSSTESLNSTDSLIFGNDKYQRKTSFIAPQALSEALSEVKRCSNMDENYGNWCRNSVKDKLYIATQGCLSNTIDDFWRMVWQEDVRIIAMITNEVERTKKCQRYWPLSGAEERHANLNVKSISEICYDDYLVRELDVSDDTQRRTVYHYQFMTWPDHGAPEQTDGVLAFIDDINRKQCQIALSKDAPVQNIICVHCSAGVGRTGTFIALDMLIDKIKFAGFNCDIDVHNTVRLVRAQRAGMVQNRAQYKFIYLALQDFILNKNTKTRKKVYISQA